MRFMELRTKVEVKNNWIISYAFVIYQLYLQVPGSEN